MMVDLGGGRGRVCGRSDTRALHHLAAHTAEQRLQAPNGNFMAHRAEAETATSSTSRAAHKAEWQGLIECRARVRMARSCCESIIELA